MLPLLRRLAVAAAVLAAAGLTPAGPVPGPAPARAATGTLTVDAATATADRVNAAVRRASQHPVWTPTPIAAAPAGWGPDAPQGVVRIVRNPASPPFAGDNVVRLSGPIRLRSDVRLEVDSGIRIVREAGWVADGPLIDLTGADNVTLTAGDRSAGGGVRDRGRSLAGRFWLDTSAADGAAGTRRQAVVLNGTGHFLVERFHTRQAATTNTAAVVARGQDAPHDGVYRHHSNTGSPFGYGANQLVSLRRVFIADIWSDGGTALRLETDGNAAGVHNVIADRIYAQHGSRIASLTPHCQVNDHIRLSHLRGVSVYYGVTLGATPEGSQDDCPARPGRFLSTVITDACVVSGTAAERPVDVGVFTARPPRGRSQLVVDDRSPSHDKIALRRVGFHQPRVRFERGVGPGADAAAPCR